MQSVRQMISVSVETVATIMAGIGLGLLAAHFWQPRTATTPQTAAAPAPAAALTADFAWLDALPDAAILLSQQRRVLKINAQCVATLGRIPIGANIEHYLRHPLVPEALEEAQGSAQAAERDLVLLTPEERRFQLRVIGFGTQTLMTLHDMSRARLTDQMRVDFVANASHELRTPLATLIGFIETLQTGAAEDVTTRERFLHIMSSEAQRMVRLIDDLLSLSRIELDKYIRPTTALELKPVIEEVRNSLLMRLQEDQRTLAVNIDQALPDVIADRDQISQVLHNLLSNAIKYGRSGSTISIDVRRLDTTTVELCVRDEGDGISPDHLPRLTERFYRADTARSRQMGGTGLGLAIVKHIVERHRGSLRIESQPGSGTSVRFTLPALS
jgi:two-component system, OmpR family, phosphate regulon sensor histidine kinase PhoR